MSRPDIALHVSSLQFTVVQCSQTNGRRNTPTESTKCPGPKVLEVDILWHVSLRIPQSNYSLNYQMSPLMQVEREA